MLLALAGAVLIGLTLGLLGSGGSILTVPVLLYLVHMPDKLAIASSLGIVGGISVVGAAPYARNRLVVWRSVLLFGFPAMAGTWSGAWVAQYLSGAVQLLIFAAVMLTAAVLMLRSRPVIATQADRAAWKIMLDGACTGVLTGTVGVGGGFIIVPALVILGGLGMRAAVGTSLVIIALASLSGFIKYLLVLSAQGQHVDWGIIALFIAVGALGSIAGHQIAGRLPHTVLRRIFGVFLVFMAIYIVWRTLPHVL